MGKKIPGLAAAPELSLLQYLSAADVTILVFASENQIVNVIIQFFRSRAGMHQTRDPENRCYREKPV
jgi:hypothetical protein